MKPILHFLWVVPILAFAGVLYLSSKGINVFQDYPVVGFLGCVGVVAMLGTFVWLAMKNVAQAVKAAIDQHESERHQ